MEIMAIMFKLDCICNNSVKNSRADIPRTAQTLIHFVKCARVPETSANPPDTNFYQG